MAGTGNKKDKVEEHIQKHQIVEFLHMPEHDQRKETLEFRNAKKTLENVEHLGCFKCGTREKRESHHIFERCWANAYDMRSVAYFLYNHFDFHAHCRRDFKNDQELLKFFVDHYNGRMEKFPYEEEIYDENGEVTGVRTVEAEVLVCDEEAMDTIYNQLILCTKHHRGEGTGVHEESAPTFMAMLVMRKGFQNALTEEEFKGFKSLLAKQHTEKYGKA